MFSLPGGGGVACALAMAVEMMPLCSEERLLGFVLAMLVELPSTRRSYDERPELVRPNLPLPAPAMPVPELCCGVDGSEP
jgi:hypothetical protein